MGVRTALEGSPPDPRRAWGRREPPYHPPRGPWHHCSSFERLRAAPRANRAESALRKNFPGCASGRFRRVPRSARAPEGIFGSDHKDFEEFGRRDALLPVGPVGLTRSSFRSYQICQDERADYFFQENQKRFCSARRACTHERARS